MSEKLKMRSQDEFWATVLKEGVLEPIQISKNEIEDLCDFIDRDLFLRCRKIV